VIDMEPNFPKAHFVIFPYVEKGMVAEAVANMNKWKLPEDNPWHLMMQTYIYSHSNQPQRAKVTLARLEKLTRESRIDSAPLLDAYIATGDNEQAFIWLEKAYSERSTALTTL